VIPVFGVAPCPPPQIEGTVVLPDGRRLGYAEFGEPTGPLVLWFHGTPGARRQVPLVGRRAAARLGLRLVCLERPGVGDSTDHTYPQLRDVSDDVAIVADRLGHDRFMVAGLSGGGPYALACAHDLPSRVVAVALMGSVVPTADDEELAEGLLALTRQWNDTLRLVRSPVGLGLTGLVRVATPVARLALEAFARILPPGDQRVLGDPDIQSMVIDDLVRGAHRQCSAVMNDLILFGRPWGFRLADVGAPVYWWHGDADPFVPIEQAYRAASLLPDVEFVVRPGESHLGEFAAADQVLTTLAAAWQSDSGGAGTIVILPGSDDLDDLDPFDDPDPFDGPAEPGPATIS
jgi:pimeloyl-ACP methyl ester carboxylesterase